MDKNEGIRGFLITPISPPGQVECGLTSSFSGAPGIVQLDRVFAKCSQERAICKIGNQSGYRNRTDELFEDRECPYLNSAIGVAPVPREGHKQQDGQGHKSDSENQVLDLAVSIGISLAILGCGQCTALYYGLLAFTFHYLYWLVKNDFFRLVVANSTTWATGVAHRRVAAGECWIQQPDDPDAVFRRQGSPRFGISVR